MLVCGLLTFLLYKHGMQREAGGDVNEGKTGGEETTISIVEVCAAAPESDLDLGERLSIYCLPPPPL